MILVTVSTLAYDPLGFLPLDMPDDAALMNVSRRVQFFATLGGSVVADDAGTSVGDQVFNLEIRPKDQFEAEQIRYLTLSYPQLYLATRFGLFVVVPVTPEFTGIGCRWNLRALRRVA